MALARGKTEKRAEKLEALFWPTAVGLNVSSAHSPDC